MKAKGEGGGEERGGGGESMKKVFMAREADDSCKKAGKNGKLCVSGT
jgi:hypothetical protein